MTEPAFVLTGRARTISGWGRRRAWEHLDEVRELRGRAVVGAVSFDPDAPDVLWEPERLDVRRGPLSPAGRAGSATAVAARLSGVLPAPELHRERITHVVELLRSGVADKVVLGRSETLEFPEPLTPHAALAGFVGTDPAGNGYLVDLGGEWLVGSSPEVLVAREGERLRAFPLAGTRPRVPGAEADADPAARELVHSAKDLDEHRYVTLALAEALAPYCTEIDVPERPQLVAAPTTWHLGTPVDGVLRRGADGSLPTALELAAAVHPTPAVCGTPDERALDIIRAVEGRGTRGFFGGAVGWCDADGDGGFRVTIRGAVLAADGRSATAWAGGGLTADSDPDLELAETVTKLARARQALGAGVGA